MLETNKWNEMKIKRRIDKAKGMLAGFNIIWKSKTIRYQTELKILKICLFTTALYACEAWTMKKTDTKKLRAFEMCCYRKILNVNWIMRMINVEVWRRLNVTENIMQSIMRKKLELFAHIWRMDNSRKIKSGMTGMMDGTGREGRPCREWIEDIKDWCQTNVYSASQIA